jgi:hypothetical protein
MPNNKHGLLLRYCDTCTRVLPKVTYQDQDEEVAAHVATVNSAVGFGVPTADDGVASVDVDVTTDVLWSLGTATGNAKPTFASADAAIHDD